MRRAGLLMLVLLGAAAAGCEMAWDLGNRGTLGRDVREIFKRHSVDVPGGTCHMIGTTRAGFCVFRASSQQVASLVSGLHLLAMNGGRASGRNVPHRPLDLDRGCRTLPSFQKGSPAEVYASTHRPPPLRLSDGVAFDYLLLVALPGAEEVCVQVSYSYG